SPGRARTRAPGREASPPGRCRRQRSAPAPRTGLGGPRAARRRRPRPPRPPPPPPARTARGRRLPSAGGPSLGLGEDRLRLVLEAAGLDRAVDSALLGGVVLPPPASGAVVLARLDGPGARGAAEAGVALAVERVDRYPVVLDVGLDLVPLPVGERVDLHDAFVVVVQLDLLDRRTRGPLVAAQTGEPCVQPLQCLHQRPH